MCDRALSAFRSWTCNDRNGFSNAEAQLTEAARQTDAVAAALGAGQSLLAAIVAGDLSTVDSSALGGQKQLAMLVTVLSALSCCALFVVGRLGRAACVAALRQAAGMRRIPVQAVAVRPRSSAPKSERVGAVPLRTVDDDDRDQPDDILGDDDDSWRDRLMSSEMKDPSRAEERDAPPRSSLSSKRLTPGDLDLDM